MFRLNLQILLPLLLVVLVTSALTKPLEDSDASTRGGHHNEDRMVGTHDAREPQEHTQETVGKVDDGPLIHAALNNQNSPPTPLPGSRRSQPEQQTKHRRDVKEEPKPVSFTDPSHVHGHSKVLPPNIEPAPTPITPSPGRAVRETCTQGPPLCPPTQIHTKTEDGKDVVHTLPAIPGGPKPAVQREKREDKIQKPGDDSHEDEHPEHPGVRRQDGEEKTEQTKAKRDNAKQIQSTKPATVNQEHDENGSQEQPQKGKRQRRDTYSQAGKDISHDSASHGELEHPPLSPPSHDSEYDKHAATSAVKPTYEFNAKPAGGDDSKEDDDSSEEHTDYVRRS